MAGFEGRSFSCAAPQLFEIVILSESSALLFDLPLLRVGGCAAAKSAALGMTMLNYSELTEQQA
jgi:hypothetical protein